MNIFVLVFVLIIQTPGNKEAHVLSQGYSSQEECEAARTAVIAQADKDSTVIGYSISPCGVVDVPTKV